MVSKVGQRLADRAFKRTHIGRIIDGIYYNTGTLRMV
jgi:hypothetical protein